MDAARLLLEKDQGLKARYQDRLASLSDDALLSWVLQQLGGCQGAWWTQTEADAAFAEIPQPQSDMIVLNMFLAEAYNGSVHQFFTNSSGTMAPQVRDALLRMGLPDHAAAVQSGMDLIGNPYPRGTDQRRAVMAGFTEAQDSFLENLTNWAEDGKIDQGMITLAKTAGLWPATEN